MSTRAPEHPSTVAITLPDGSKKEFPGPVTALQVAESIGAGLAKASLAAKINGRIVDLSAVIDSDASIELLTSKSPDSLLLLRHSCTHLMAQAVKRLRPGAMLEDGPPTEDGYWYDIKCEPPITPDDFPAIEAEMEKIVKEALPIRRRELSRAEALKLFGSRSEKYKLDLIERLADDVVISTYEQGEFVDLCRGPHVPHTGVFKAFKLMAVAGAYWRGDANNEQLTRVKGTAFHDRKALDEHLHNLEEAKRRDHRKLGQELDLFMHHDWAPGETFWLPKGRVVYKTLSDMVSRFVAANGYQEVFTPMVFKKDLFETSGHWDHYRDNMFLIYGHDAKGKLHEIDDTVYALKPMNCPSHMLIFKEKKRSYRELPMRIFDQGVLHRNEVRGALSGLTRVRQFCQDDSHIFLSQEMIEEEITRLIALVRRMYSAFGMEFAKVYLSTRPAQALGSKEQWDDAEAALMAALKSNNMPYQVNAGDGAFYGPKIDFIVADALKREWQTVTIQLDYQLPARFGLTYVAKDNTEKCPIVVHRAIYGSFERFIGILIEHYAGAFPVWLAPEQVRVLTISEKHVAYGEEVLRALLLRGVRATLDKGDDKIGSKIRDARLAKVPYMLVVGEKEAEQRSVSVRTREKEEGPMPLDGFLARIEGEKGREF